MESSATVVLREKNKIAYLKLNRPHACNALNQTLIQELSRYLKSIAEDPSIRLVVLEGEGQHFCAGADIKEMSALKNASHEKRLQEAQHLNEMLCHLSQVPQPIIACIQGQVRGGGLGLVSCVDIAIASDNAEFAFSETRLGLIPALISPYVVAAIGARHAFAYMLSAEVFSATEALRIGLIHKSTTNLELSNARDILIATLLRNGPCALKEVKALAKTLRNPVPFGLQENLMAKLAELQGHEEAREGLLAFIEKRKPTWAIDVS